MLKFKTKIRLTPEWFAELSFILFFSWGFVRTAIGWLVGGGVLADWIALIVVYLPLLIACIMRPRRYIKPDFLLLYLFVLLFILMTALVHPEYSRYYNHEIYGVWPHVLIPYRGIYAYLFIRLLEDPKKLIRGLKVAGYFMLVYFLYWYSTSMARGYWTGVAGSNSSAEMSYSVEFGYSVLPFALLFLSEALRRKKLSDNILAAVMLALILAAGSRGPVLFIGVFVALYVLTELRNAKYRWLIITCVSSGAALLYSFYQEILVVINSILGSLGVSSRFITMMMNGTISNDSGRGMIWDAAVRMIQEKPMGYGAMGTRFKISKIIVAGYPHSVILEILVDFGVVFGGIILLVMAVKSVEMLLHNDDDDMRLLFLVYFSSACSLFLSMTYWSVPTFWVCIALTVNHSRNKRRTKLAMPRKRVTFHG